MVHLSHTLLLGRKEENENWALSLGMCLLTDGGGGRFQDREQAEMDTADQNEIALLLGLPIADLY